jgi:hypothetical protein
VRRWHGDLEDAWGPDIHVDAEEDFWSVRRGVPRARP